MGQVLSHPIRSQLLQRRGNEHYMVASSEMQGCRMAMEDTHTIALSLSEKHKDLSLFAVFDGHAGTKASLYLEKELYLRIGELDDPTNQEQLEEAMVACDQEFLSREDDREDGSTCVFAIVKPPESKEEKSDKDAYEVTVVNVGDSRVIIIRADGTCVPMTTDHKPETESEKKRIVEAGGSVQMNRVDGQLAMSRAIGDWQYKSDPDLPHEKQKVLAIPDVTREKLYHGDALLVCCDGIVEQMSNEDTAKIVHENLPKFRDDPAEILSLIFDQSLKSGSKDNHSALLILPQDGTSYAREDEFRAGPFTPFRNDPTFVKHYEEDAKKHGYEGEELIRMAEKTEESMPELADVVINDAPMGAGGAAQFVQILSQQPGDVKDKLMMLLSGGGPVSLVPESDDTTETTGSTEMQIDEIVEAPCGEAIDTAEVEEGTMNQVDDGVSSESVPSEEPSTKVTTDEVGGGGEAKQEGSSSF